jgi:TRAP-type mannitol/chloroaromatic compound transport system permease small subunit
MDVFDLIGGPKQLPLYAYIAPIPIVLVMFWFEFQGALRRSPDAAAGERLLYLVDALSTAVGKTYAWSILILTLTTSYEVFSRYMFGAPTDWAFDAAYMLYGTLFMMAGAYALSRNAHVRGDFIYRAWKPRTQAGMDLVLFFLFFFPGMLAFIYSGYGFAELSRGMNEHSAASPNGPIVWPFKWLISIVGCLMVMQGIVEVARCIMTIRSGEWPQRLHDVEELEKVMLAKAEHGEYQVVKELKELGVSKGDV